MEAVVSSPHVLINVPSFSGGGLFTPFPCCSVGSLPQEIALHELLQCESFPQATVLCKLVQCEFLLQGTVLQLQTAIVWVPYGITSPANKHTPAWSPVFMGAQIQHPNILQHGLLMWLQPSVGICLSSVGSLGCRCILMAVVVLCWWLNLMMLEVFYNLNDSMIPYLLHCKPLWAAEGQSASRWSSPWAAALLECLEQFLLLLHWPHCLQTCFFHIFLLLSPAAVAVTQQSFTFS